MKLYSWVRFIGLIDDLMIRKMSVKEITQHQTPAKATEVIAKILRIIKQDSIDVPKVQVKDIDFSSATMPVSYTHLTLPTNSLV